MKERFRSPVVRPRARLWAAATAVTALGSLGAISTVEAKGWQPPKSPGPTVVAPPTTRPATPPRGARFLCRDGTYSFVGSQKVACWGHGGVSRKL